MYNPYGKNDLIFKINNFTCINNTTINRFCYQLVLIPIILVLYSVSYLKMFKIIYLRWLTLLLIMVYQLQQNKARDSPNQQLTGINNRR